MASSRLDKTESSRLTLGQRSRRGNGGDSTLNKDSRLSDAYRTRSMAQVFTSTRSADLSQRVGRVEQGMSSVNNKLDKLLELMPPASATSTPHRHRPGTHRDPGTYLDFERELRRADPQFEPTKGKDPIKDFYVNNMIPRPFMFINGPGIHSQKDKMAYRDKMTFNEYVWGFTNMLRDRRAYPEEDWPHLIEHLNQVACDAQTRPWNNVRTWSDTVFSRIEAGDITWADKQEIYFDRLRLSLAPPTDANPHHIPTGPDNTKVIICSDFNARRCKHRAAHTEAGTTLLHSCAWCYAALGSRNPHTVVQCENKLRFSNDRPAHQPQQVHPPHQRQAFTQQPQQQHQQLAKRPVFTTAVINNQPPTRPKNDM